MGSTAACRASRTRCCCGRRETSKCQQSSARSCSSAAASSTGRRAARPGLRPPEPNRPAMGDGLWLALLYDAIDSVQSFISVFIYIYTLLILAYIITSWIRLPYSPWLNRIQRFLYDVCEPYLRLFRRILPTFGPLDLSPVVAVAVLVILGRVVNVLLGRLH